MNHTALLLLLVLCWATPEASMALTLSSRLVHTFSDEAKFIWMSRTANASGIEKLWPNKTTFEYSKLLLHKDFKRHRMKVKDLVVPAHGGHTLFFGNELDWLHYTWIDIGKPNVSFLVALDAGSDYLWVPCDCIQCSPLSALNSTSLDKDLGQYNPASSTTSKRLPCNHELCDYSSTCHSATDPCPYIASYDDFENTSSSGFLVVDTLHMALAGRHSPRSLEAEVIIGCGRKQSGSYLDGAAPDGVMGLGPGKVSVPSMLANAGLIRNSFSLCFDESHSGRILFGDQGHTNQKSTPFLPIGGDYISYFVQVDSCCVGNSCSKRSGFRALIDSGASFTFLPTEVYNEIVQRFDDQANAKRISSQGVPWDYCYNASSKQFRNLPTLRLRFRTNQSFVVHDPTYSIPQNQDWTLFCLALQPTDSNYGIIGQNFMTGYSWVFDMENLTLSWSNSNCQDVNDNAEVNAASPPNDQSPNPLPTNDQQSIPSKHAVSPAVAGRTSSKPSSASNSSGVRLHRKSLILLLMLISLSAIQFPIF